MRFFHYLLLAFFLSPLCISHSAHAEPPLAVKLRMTTMNYPVSVPPSRPVSVAPALKETLFPLARAANYKELAAWLNPEQKAYLEKHRFLLLPSVRHLEDLKGGADLWDEMLTNLARIGGSSQAQERRPENALLVTPDPFLHALHKYVSERMKKMEHATLAPALQRYLAAMYDNILRLKAQASPVSVRSWERLQAKMLVPLLLAGNCRMLKLSDADRFNDEARQRADAVDTVENALLLLDGYRSGLSLEAAAKVEKELRLIYKADQTGEGEKDYTRYTPRGHYETTADMRAYFRAMLNLSAGWNLTESGANDGLESGPDDGLKDSLNFAIAMSLPVSPALTASIEKLAPSASADPLESWRIIMSISAFYSGYPDEAAYPEWADYIRQHLPGQALTANSASDPAVIAALRDGLDDLKAGSPFFSTLRTPRPTTLLRIFPQRFTPAWLLADHLTTKSVGAPDLPSTFSGLWVPVVFGSEYAASLLPEQTLRLTSGNATATPDIGPAQKTVYGPQHLADPWVTSLRESVDALKAQLAATPEKSWFSSVGAAWLYLLRTQTATYGVGYPLYMRDPAFAAKQLQTYMGSFTERKHDMLLYENFNFSPASGTSRGVLPPVPKGFVEPNLAFWHELLRVARMLGEIEVQPEYTGNTARSAKKLDAFIRQIDLCIRLSEKELRNEPITGQEYEQLRTGMNLDYMAEPYGGNAYRDADGHLSGLIVDVQTDGRNQLVVYEATAKPLYMLALVGNENSPRLVLGVAYNHYEFTAPAGPRFTDKQWKARVYHSGEPLPEKNFWYAPLAW